MDFTAHIVTNRPVHMSVTQDVEMSIDINYYFKPIKLQNAKIVTIHFLRWWGSLSAGVNEIINLGYSQHQGYS